jgi:hypothetical protein
VKEGPAPVKVIFTELAVGLENDWHCCPSVQLVITLKGSWCGARAPHTLEWASAVAVASDDVGQLQFV